MLAFRQPPYWVRRAAACEASLIEDLRLASLLALEMPEHSLRAIRAVMQELPDFHPELVGAGRYFVADGGGDLLGGVGWSVLPLSFRAECLVDAEERPAELSLGDASVLVRGFFLDPDLGRRGAGAALLAAVEADACRLGYLAAEMVAPASSQLYYRGLGFKTAGRLGLRIGRGEVLPMLQMRKCFPAHLAMAA